MEYSVVVGFCAGSIDECVRGFIHRNKKKGYFNEVTFFEMTNYSYLLDSDKDVFELMSDTADVLMEISDMYSFDSYRGCIVYDFDLLKSSNKKYKGFDNLLSVCLVHIEEMVNDGKELGIEGFVFCYSDFREEFPEEFRKFDFVSEYNFMEMLNQYIDYIDSEEFIFRNESKSFDKDNGFISVYS